MKRLCLQNPHITASKIQAEIALTGRRVPSVDTIKRRSVPTNCSPPAVKPELTRKQRRARLRLCREHKHWTVADWRRVLLF